MFYLRSCGIDLGTFGPAIFSSAFKEQSIKWASMIQAYVSHVIVVIHRFLVIALNILLPMCMFVRRCVIVQKPVN